MHLNFFISGSKPATRYVVVFFTGIVLLLFITGASVLDAILKSELSHGHVQLLKYQKSKLRQNLQIDVALLGDSSLGNSIDAHAWSKKQANNTISLALTGAYGFGGTYIFAKEAISRGAKYLVIVNTIDIFNRPIEQDYKAVVFASSSLRDILNSDIGFKTVFETILSIDLATSAFHVGLARLFHYQAPNKYPVQLIKKVDYIPQGKPIDTNQFDGRINLKKTALEKTNFLKKIAELCRQYKVTCYYAHGPIHKSYCINSIDYIKKLNNLIASANIELLSPLPYCLNDDEVGDSADHVHPDLKQKVSGWYLSQFRSKVKVTSVHR